MVILSSPSGAGKTTLVALIRKKRLCNISITPTRTPRFNEVDGKDYHFVNNESFQKMIISNEFLEYAKVFKNFYGTTKSNIFDELSKGNNVIFDIDWQGTNQIISQKLKNKLLTFYLATQ